ncbi:MAG: hypothetical protein AABZ44_00685, partial [Elusimicrobiota bacterium]
CLPILLIVAIAFSQDTDGKPSVRVIMERLKAQQEPLAGALRSRGPLADVDEGVAAMSGLFEALRTAERGIYPGTDAQWQTHCDEALGILKLTQSAARDGDWKRAQEVFAGLAQLRRRVHKIHMAGFLSRIGSMFKKKGAKK